MNPNSSLANQASPEDHNHESYLGGFPSPASHHTRFSRSSTLAGSRTHSISNSSYLSPSSPGFPFSCQESKSDKSSLLAHERPINARRNSSKKQWFKEWWLWEMGGCALSVSCTIIIVVFLPYLDDQPLNRWNWVMGPNTFISTLITVAKTSMLLPVAECLSQLKWKHFWLKSRPLAEIEAFDEASRGPWGAFVFAWKTKLKSRIALMGAFIMVGALTMEPLAQQIVQFETRYRRPPLEELKAEDRSSIIVAQAYNLQTPSKFENEPFEAAQDLQGAFFDGVFGVPRLISSSCPNGNCTWSDFLSLGVCSSCQDIIEAATFEDFPCEQPASETCVYRNYTDIGDEFRDVGWPFAAVMGNQSGNTLAQSASSYVADLDYSTQVYQNAADWGSMADIILGRFDQYLKDMDKDRDGHLDVINQTSELTKCTISWCAQLYTNFSYQNTTSYMPYKYTKLDLPLKRQNVGEGSETVVYTIDFTETAKKYPNLTEPSLHAIYNRTFANTNHSSSTFEVGKNDYLVTSYFLGDMLAFELRDQPYSQNINKFEQIFGRALLHSPNVSRTFASIAQSISSQVRESFDARRPHRFAVDGQANVAETYVRIRKRWFVVPASLVLLTVIFLVTTLLANGWGNAPSWKSGTLPLLFHGLEGWGEFGDEETELMRARARGMRARLKENGEGVVKFMKV